MKLESLYGPVGQGPRRMRPDPDLGRVAGADVPPLDLPLSGRPYPHNKLHPWLYAAEVLGTALLVFVGLSTVIALWGMGSPFRDWPIVPAWRRFLNGLLFGSVGAAIAYSPLGRISGAHINPAMTWAFLLAGRLKWRDAACYLAAQLVGASIGVLCLLFWGRIGVSDTWGASVPDPTLPVMLPLAGEAICTFMLVALVFFVASRPRIRHFTPLINPPLFAILSWLEAPLSGASANPARSFAPELLSGHWAGWWVYWLGPALGAALAVGAYKARLLGRVHLPQAKLFHFGHPGVIARTPPGRNRAHLLDDG